MPFKIGQREVAAVPFILIAILSVAVGVPRENIVEYLSTIAAPLTSLVATLVFFTQTITANVTAGKYNPGDIFAALYSKEFVYAIATAIGSGAMMIGITLDNGQKQLMVDTIGNGLLFIGAALQRSFAVRPPFQPNTTEVIVAQQAAVAGATKIESAQGVKAETINAETVRT